MGLFDYIGRALTRQERMRSEVNTLRKVGWVSGEEPFSWEWDVRKEKYAEWHHMYCNSVYLKQKDGGLREVILREVFGITADVNIVGAFNAVKPIVDAYQNALYGRFGTGEATDPGDIIPVALDGRSAADFQPMRNSVRRVWRASNFDTQKELFATTAAMLGSVLLRVVAEPNPDPLRRHARMQVEHPGRVKDFEEDAQGNVTAVLLKYSSVASNLDADKDRGGLGEKAYDVEIEEYLGRDRFRVWRDGKKVYDEENDLGVCPMVMVRQSDLGGEYGRPAFYGSESPIHWLNKILTATGRSIEDHANPKWFASGAGQSPKQFKLGNTTLSYVTVRKDDPSPTLEAIVADLDHGKITEAIERLVSYLFRTQPELILTTIESFSSQSGETIAQLLKPVVQCVTKARASYEAGIVKAVQIAASWRMLMGVAPELGGATREEADRAYHTGKLDFAFRDRPALPMTSFERERESVSQRKGRDLDVAAARQGQAFLPPIEVMRIYTGGDEKRAWQLAAELAASQEVETEPDDFRTQFRRATEGANGNG